MKWKNKGHEYDDIFLNMKKKKSYYLFGAGDFGKQFLHAMDSEIEILGFVDNSPEKVGTEVDGKRVFAFDKELFGDDIGLILTVSQMPRGAITPQVEAAGLVRDRDYFIHEEFLSVWQLYENDKVYFSNISFLPSTICNLNCRYCLNFNPFAKEFYLREWDALIRDVDLFFSCVDHILLFHVSGGEPFLYKQIGDLVEYIDKNYRDRIDILRTVTNGTVVPNKELLEQLSGCRVEVTVDDYRDTVPRFRDRYDQVIAAFKEYGIPFEEQKIDGWVNLAPEETDYSDRSESWMRDHRSKCGQAWQELRDGKIYSCNYAAYATVACIAGQQDLEETYDLTAHTSADKAALVEFRLGYTTKGYTEFCRKCRGFTPENEPNMEPAEQIEVGKMWARELEVLNNE